MKYASLLLLAVSVFFVSCQSKQEKQNSSVRSQIREYYADKGNVEKAKLLDSALKSYTAAYPRDTATPQFLFEDAILHEGILNNLVQAAALYNQIYTDYPDNPLAPKALFSYAFLHDTKLDNQGEARKAYNTFLVKYPNHDLADDARANLDILGKDLNEVVKGFQQRDSTVTP
jgi:TolA-binding protein